MFYSLDKLKPKSKTKKTIFLLPTLVKNFKRGQENFFPLLKKCFFVPPYSEFIVVKFSFTPTKNILVFSFRVWFQFIQRIEQKTEKSIFFFSNASEGFVIPMKNLTVKIIL